MNTEKNLTGYPSIDRPWLKYYTEEAINAPIPECTIYEYLMESSARRKNKIALDYMNRQITYGELFQGIDDAAHAFYQAGVRQGDIVVGIAPSFPEIIYSFYGINKIGAVSDWFDPRTESLILAEELAATKAKVVILFEDFIERFREAIEQSDVETVIVVRAKDSLGMALKLLLSLKGKKKYPAGWVAYPDFVAAADKTIDLPILHDMAHQPALMEHTGGTTGRPKAVVLSNQNVTTVIHQYRNSGAPFTAGDTRLAMAFPFTAYTIICGHALPLTIGVSCILCFDLDISKIENIILKKKINHMANTPVLWEEMIHSKLTQKADLAFLKLPAVGADHLDVEKEEEINEFLKLHGCEYKLSKGYGMTEVSSAVCMCSTNECNKIGSVGIPWPNTIISVFDTDSGKELPYGKQGEICISGPGVMLGYFQNETETANVLKRHEDGLLWMHSGDYGHMDEDGFLFIDGRIKRMLIDYIGFKIFAPTVEAVLSRCPVVDKCCVVGAPDTEHGVGQIAVAFVILRENVSDAAEAKRQMREYCVKNLPSFQIPARFVVTDKFPYTSAAKVDYQALEQFLERKEMTNE